MRDRSGLGRAEFYERFMTPADWQDQTLESGLLPAPHPLADAGGRILD
jgi:hypothetical protein